MASDSHSFVDEPQTPRREIRHRSSLEHILSFTLHSPPPSPSQIKEATLLFHLILDDCKAAGVPLCTASGDGDAERADRDEHTDDIDGRGTHLIPEDDGDGDTHPISDDDRDGDPSDFPVLLYKLFRAIYNYCPTPEGKVDVVRVVLHGLFPVDDYDNQLQRALRRIIPRAKQWLNYTATEKERVYGTLAIFANDFLQGFFVPLKAQGRSTPAVSTLITPTSRSEVGPHQGITTRLGNLRRLCLARDGGRCVMTQSLDKAYQKTQDALLPRGRRPPKQASCRTEAAHIIPHALNALSGSATTLNSSKCLVWRILNMFAPGISNSLAGDLIDTPANAMILIPELHERFGSLELYLQETETLHTYTWHLVRGAYPLLPSVAPRSKYVVFVNRERDGVPAELPSPHLLAVHRACCMMLAMSGAAEYVEELLDDTEALMQRGVLAEDGSSNFALMMGLRGVQERWGTQDWEFLPTGVMAK